MKKPTTKANIHKVVQMRDAIKLLSEGHKTVYRHQETGKEDIITVPFLFSWDFRCRLADIFDCLEKKAQAFEASRSALSVKHTGDPATPKPDHPKYQPWLLDVNELAKEESDLPLPKLGIKEFNGDENRTLPADIIVKLRPIIDMEK